MQAKLQVFKKFKLAVKNTLYKVDTEGWGRDKELLTWFFTRGRTEEPEKSCWKFHIYMNPEKDVEDNYFGLAADVIDYIKKSKRLDSKQVYDFKILKKLGKNKPWQRGKAVIVYLFLKEEDAVRIEKVRALARRVAGDLDKLIVKNGFKPESWVHIEGSRAVPGQKSGRLFYRYERKTPGPGPKKDEDDYRGNMPGEEYNIPGNPDIFPRKRVILQWLKQLFSKR